jgi:DNA end-binding protein Ku
MARTIWKGAVSFGLVYIPVQMYSASRSHTLDLDFLDKRDFSPVGYQRVNKKTGKLVEWADIVKGYQYQKGQYVALSEEDFRKANVKATQTIDIAQFVSASTIPSEFFETPYYLEPAKGGAKVYALLREALRRSSKVGVATFVMRAKQHLAAVQPHGKVLVLNTLRFAEEISSADKLDLPAAGEKAAGLSAKELAMAERLIEEMSGEWEPDEFKDTYRHDLMKRIEEKIAKHQTHKLTPTEKGAEPRQSAQVIDLMDVLRQSLKDGGGRKAARKATSARTSQAARETHSSRKTSRTRRRRPSSHRAAG